VFDNYGTVTSIATVNHQSTFNNIGTFDNSGGSFQNSGVFISECGSTLVGTLTGNPPIVISCDVTPPVLTVPSDITAEATSTSGAIVTYIATAVDDTDGAVTPSCFPNSGSTFTLGTTTVTCTASDAAGNMASASFNVTVVNVAPVANDDYAVTDEDTAIIIDPVTNDNDPNGDPLAVTSLSSPTNGIAIINPDGTVTYVPALNFNGSDSYSYTVLDGNGGSATATVYVTIRAVNDAPVANDDVASTNEDTAVTISVLANDSDVDGDALTVVSNSGAGNGMVVVNGDGSFTYTPNADYNGADSFSYTVEDGNGGSDTATVSITINAVNDTPVVTIDVASQSVQYSDAISTVTISAYDIDSTTLTLSQTGLPASTSPGSANCTPSGFGTSCSWTVNGIITAGQGTYDVDFSVSDGEFSPSKSTTIVVLREDATLTLDDNNTVAVGVDAPGSDSSVEFSLTVTIEETEPDTPIGSVYAGDINLANVTMTLQPVGPGGSVTSQCAEVTEDSGYDAVTTVTCTFDDAPVNTYTVVIATDDAYYDASTEDVLTVFDPSLGFTSGGGWFAWPGTEEKTNFGYTMKYNKKGSKVQGSLLMIRHLPDGTKYRIKSNALEGLALGEDSSVPLGWASFSGKSTYLEPDWEDAQGNYSFTVYVEDHDEPGTGTDVIWIETRDKDGLVIPAMSRPEPAAANAIPINGGNIVVPHSNNGGGGRR
jgi:hypothetical protein